MTCVAKRSWFALLQLQEKKRAMTTSTLSGDKVKNQRLGLDDLVALFRGNGHDEED